MNRRARYVVLLGCLVGLVLAGSALGSDQPTIIYPEHEERVVHPGETVEVNLYVDSDGGYGDAGVAHITMNASFDPEYVQVTAVELASYLEEGEPTEVHEETSIDNDAGIVVAEQWRDPPRNGSTGTHLFATVTFEVADDAPETNTTVSLADSGAKLVGDHELFVYEHNATFVIEERTTSTEQSASESEEHDNSDGGASGAMTEGNNDESVPGNDAVGTDVLVALVVALALLVGGALSVRKRR